MFDAHDHARLSRSSVSRTITSHHHHPVVRHRILLSMAEISGERNEPPAIVKVFSFTPRRLQMMRS
jgi:hypothetical protein